MLQYRSSRDRYRIYEERANCMNYSREFEEKESSCRGKLSQSTGSRSKSSIYGEPRPKHATWHMEFVWDTGKRCWQSTSHARFITDVLSRNSSLNESTCHRRKPSAEKYRGTCRWKWRTNWKHNSNANVCREAVNHEFFPTSGKSTEFYGWSAKTANIGASVWQIFHTLNVFMLEDKIPNPGKLMFRFSLGSYVADQRSGGIVDSVDD